MTMNSNQKPEGPKGFRMHATNGRIAMSAAFLLSMIIGLVAMQGFGLASATKATATAEINPTTAFKVVMSGPVVTRTDRTMCRTWLPPRKDGSCPVHSSTNGVVEYEYGKYVHIVHRTAEQVEAYLADDRIQEQTKDMSTNELNAFRNKLANEDVVERVFCGGCNKGSIDDETVGPVTFIPAVITNNSNVNGVTK